MASSSFTTNLGLCNWTDNDRPKRADFVMDNEIIDNIVGSHVTNTIVHVSPADKEKIRTPFVTFVYAGTGESSRRIETTFQPYFAVVYKKNAPPVSIDNGVAVVNSGCTGYGNSGTSGVAISTNCVLLQQEATASDGKRISLNEEGCQYTLIAFK